ncbi:MAG: hypothetical protein ACE5MH_00050 [Terriglobia bacterium]
MRRVLVGLVFAGLFASLPAGLAAAEVHKGRLRILASGEVIGSERYEIAATATEINARGEITLQIGDQRMHQTSNLLLTADLAPRSYEWKLEEPEQRWLRLEFSGSQGTIRYPLAEGKEDKQVFDFGTTRVALLDNNVFHHFLLLARLYDFSKGGPQAIQVFIPQSLQPGVVTAELKGVETQIVEGQLAPVRQLVITSEDNQVLLWVTESGRFVRLQAPQENIEVVPERVAP